MAETAGIRAAIWVVGKALAPLSGNLVENWAASSSLAPNIQALKTQLLCAEAMLENVRGREIHNNALAQLLQILRALAYSAEDVLDELDYFRIQDELEGTFETLDRGCFHNLVRDARHAIKNAAKQLECTSSCFSACCNSKREDGGARRRLCCGDGSTHDEEESCNCLRQFTNHCRSRSTVGSVGKRSSHDLQQYSSNSPGNGKQNICGGVCTPTCMAPWNKKSPKTPKLDFDRVDASKRMRQIADQLKQICADISPILSNFSAFKLSANLELLSSGRSTDIGTSRTQRESTSQSIEPKFYGRDFEKNTIIANITGGKCLVEDLNVVPIVGPGGIGKTTLTQEVYNNPDVQKHFDVTIWICVSLSFSLYRLTKEIAKSILKAEGKNDGAVESCNLDQLHREIENNLKNKRLLLVLDDIWEYGNEDDWAKLLFPLRNGQVKGNTVLVTTRFLDVANMVKTTNIVIQLDRLSPAEFWDYFVACVFGHGESNKQLPESSDLHSIGKQIVEKLKGSPLAAKTVGRLLRKIPTPEHWRRVLESKEWEAQTGEHDIMPALKLSYDHLPFDLQQCFSYCALFPEDYMFDSQELIRFWIGLDILRPSHPGKTIEDIGLDHLVDLINYGFFKEEINEWRTHPYYVMHDLLHDLAIKVSSQECLHIDSSRATPIEIPPSLYHLSISFSPANSEHGTSKNGFKEELGKMGARLEFENLHTLMIFGEYDQSFAVTFSDLFKYAKSLRLVCLSSMTQPVESILYSFSKLVHLRYINLQSEDRKDRSQLPASLSRFYHLRVLDLGRWGGASCTLPVDDMTTNLSKLRHFLVPYWALEHTSDIPNIGKLSCLQELRAFKVRNQSDGFQLCELGKLAELGGSLSIHNLENAHVNEAHEAKLLYKKRLQKLALCWGYNRSDKKPDIENQILERLQPHNNIRELKIKQHGGSSCPTWISKNLSLKDLEGLHLDGANWKMLPPIGELWLTDGSSEEYFGCIVGQTFRNLKTLELVGLPNLRKWTAKELCPIFFSVMEVLIVKECSELVELPFSYYSYFPSEGDGKATWFPRLKDVTICNCPKLVSLPPIPYSQTLFWVDIRDVGTGLKQLGYQRPFALDIEGNKDLNDLNDNVLSFSNLTQLDRLSIRNCPPMVGRLQVLTSLKKLKLHGSSVMLKSLGNESKYDSEWQLPVEDLSISNWHAGGKALAQFLSHLPKLSCLNLEKCHKITRLCVAVEEQQTTLVEATESNQQQQVAEDIVDEDEIVPQLTMNQEQKGDDGLDGLLLFPVHLSNSLHRLYINECPELILLARPPLSTSHSHKEQTGQQGLQALRSLEGLSITKSPKFLSAYETSSGCPFPSSVKKLYISGRIEIVQPLDFLSNINFINRLCIERCGEDLRCEGLWPLLAQGRLSALIVTGTPRYFAALELGGLQDEQEQQQLLQHSSKLRFLSTDAIAEVLVKPFCSILSSSLTNLNLCLSSLNDKVERFTKEQEEALQLLTSLQDLIFNSFHKLLFLPAGLHRLTNLKTLSIWSCPSIQSLLKDDLPSSLQELDVSYCDNKKLKRQCSKIKRAIPEIKLQYDSVYSRQWTILDEFSDLPPEVKATINLLEGKNHVTSPIRLDSGGS